MAWPSPTVAAVGRWALTGGLCTRRTGGQVGVPRTAGPDLLSGVAFADGSNGWAAGQNGTILHTTNGGSSRASQTVGPRTGFMAWTSPTGATVGRWVTGGTIVHTTNGGSSWVGQTSGTTNVFMAWPSADGSNGWAVGQSGTILHYSGAPITVPQAVVIKVIGNDLRLDWNTDTNPYYRVYSGSDPMGIFSTFKGSTADTTFTIVNGAATYTMRFYQVVGTDSP